MYLFIHGDENVPGVISTHATGLSVKVSGSRAVMKTRLTHRYSPKSTGDPRRLVLTARALLVRDAAGVWRLATPETLFPLFGVRYRRPLSDRRLRALYRRLAGEGRAQTGHRLRVQRQAIARRARQPCTAPSMSDPAGDVLVETVEPARDQAAHSGGDVLSAGFDGRCLTVRTTGPLPAAFSLVGDDDVAVEVANGTVSVFSGDPADEVKPIRGAVADLGPNGLTVQLPRRVPGVRELDLNVDLNSVTYGDSAKVG
jgi:hypothetical protein